MWIFVSKLSNVLERYFQRIFATNYQSIQDICSMFGLQLLTMFWWNSNPELSNNSLIVGLPPRTPLYQSIWNLLEYSRHSGRALGKFSPSQQRNSGRESSLKYWKYSCYIVSIHLSPNSKQPFCHAEHWTIDTRMKITSKGSPEQSSLNITRLVKPFIV